jgi:hypothetical protein
LDSGCYARIVNPLQGASLQTGAGVTFWVKTARQDLESALFSFGDMENETSPNFYFTENAHLSYTVKGQLETLNLDVNNPSSVKTNAIGEGWHYVALQLLSNGYTLYVDGIKEAEQTLVSERSTSFSYQTLLNHLTTAPYFYLAAGSETALVESWFDDINFYTNSLTSKEITRPKKGLFASTTTETFEYIVGDPITSVGSADCSAGWWTTFSDYFEIPANHTLTLNFINHTSGVNNWNNWNLCVATDAERDGAGYDEYFVIRSDLYGWGGSYNASNWSSEGYGDWDLFRQNMEGADVTITITRKNEMVYVTAVATCTDGTVYTEWFNAVCGDGLETINAFLIVDGSYLEMKAANCFLSTSVY